MILSFELSFVSGIELEAVLVTPDCSDVGSEVSESIDMHSTRCCAAQEGEL